MTPTNRTSKIRSPNSPATPRRSQSNNSHWKIACKYARDIVAGKILACKWVIAACQRHIKDLERAKSNDFPFKPDPARGERVCKFIGALPHTKGKWALNEQTISLEPFQCFIVCSLFSWVHKQTKNYRFREAYICVPRKNAKSTLAAGIGLYKFAADQEYGSEVYSGATTEKQAWEVFKPAHVMSVKTPALRKAFGITVNAKSLTILKNFSKFEPVIGKPGDGASPSCAIVDEYHEHLSDELYDTMKTGMGARENPLLLVITTAGSDRSGPCYALQKDVEKILEGIITNERVFGIIYTIDDDDDWKSVDALKKANPNLGVSVDEEFLRDALQGAVNSARKQNVFKTKHLNVWVSADVAWMNMVKWDEGKDTNLNIDQFNGQHCIASFDLASRKDIASKVRVFRRSISGKKHYYIFGAHYLNQAAVDDSKGSHYWGWSNEGRLVVTSGNITDYLAIADDIVEDAKQFVLKEVPFDEYHSAGLIQFIQAREDWNQGVPFVKVPQTVAMMSPAMRELEAIVLDGRIHHDGDPVLGWMISNVVCHTDIKGNIFPRKQREENKIDGATSLLMCINRWMAQPLEEPAEETIEIW